MEEINKQIEELRTLGLSDDKIVALIEIYMDEFFDNMEEDLLDLSDEDLEKLEKQLEDKENNPEQVINNLLNSVYGLSSDGKLNQHLLQSLKEDVEKAKRAKDFITKAQQYDPEVLQQILDAQNHPDYDAISSAMEEVADL